MCPNSLDVLDGFLRNPSNNYMCVSNRNVLKLLNWSKRDYEAGMLLPRSDLRIAVHVSFFLKDASYLTLFKVAIH